MNAKNAISSGGHMFTQIKDQINHEEILKILADCVFDNSEKGLKKVCQDYQRHKTWQLFAWRENEQIQGVCGFEIHPDWLEILHIAVSEANRNQGIGGLMLNELKKHNLPIEAETDDDAVNFYRKNGFTTTALQKYNVRRWACVYHKETTL
jgi:ribosomal protein S18 acetylase RimI-like enzyme